MILDGDPYQLGQYLRRLADMMGLKDWKLAIGDTPPEEASMNACVELVFGRRVAVISFQDRWPSWTPEDLRQTCTHELLHCHFNQILWPVNGITKHVGLMIYEPLYDAVNDRIEEGVDAVAEAWAKALPLPSEEAE